MAAHSNQRSSQFTHYSSSLFATRYSPYSYRVPPPMTKIAILASDAPDAAGGGK